MERRSHLIDWSKYPNFTREEFKCPHCERCYMSEHFMDRLQKTRTEYGRPMIVTSGYRCPEYNNQISSTGLDGPHTTGRAVDIHVYGNDAHRLLYHAFQNGFSGIGINQKGDRSGRFIHLDTLENPPRPNVWSY